MRTSSQSAVVPRPGEPPLLAKTNKGHRHKHAHLGVRAVVRFPYKWRDICHVTHNTRTRGAIGYGT